MTKINLVVLACILTVFMVRLSFAGADEGKMSIPAGEFTMGDRFCADEQSNADWCRDEVPHKVRLDRYSIDKYEVTVTDYKQCAGAGVCVSVPMHEFRARDFIRPKQPVVFVRHEDAAAYCEWKGGKLPTEAQWERAAQGKLLGGAYFGQPYNTGSPRNVGELEPNSNGLYDMIGNAYEWTADWYGPYETGEVRENPGGPSSGKDKVVRGGSWNSPTHFLRTSDRVARSPELRYSDVGFRCVSFLK